MTKVYRPLFVPGLIGGAVAAAYGNGWLAFALVAVGASAYLKVVRRA